MLVPRFDAYYGAALQAASPLPAGARVLDLGAGTGLLAGLLLAREPRLRATLVDLSPEMLEQASHRFEAMRAGGRIKTVRGDYSRDVPAGPFDAVVSALSIHHLADAGKRRVYAVAFDRLRPGGVFVNADQVAGDSPAESAANDRAWETAAREAGADDAMIARARERMVHDRNAPVPAQLGWLQAAGFDEVRCAWRHGQFAVRAGRRPV